MKTFFTVLGVIFALILVVIVGIGMLAANNQPVTNVQERLQAMGIAAREETDRKNNAAIDAHQARISMTGEEVLRALGSPDSIDPPRAETSKYTKQLWHYGDNYVSFGWDDTVNAVSSEIDFDKTH